MTGRATARVLLRVMACLLGVVFISYAAVRGLLAYEASRAGRMMHDLKSVRIGDIEPSLLPICKKYDGYRWVSKFRGPYDERPDYEYVLEVNPWRFELLTNHPRRFDSTIRRISALINPRFRRAIGLRRWNVIASVALKEGRVIGVSSAAVVEGKREYLGTMWNLSETIPKSWLDYTAATGTPPPLPPLVRLTNLNMADGLGQAVKSWITPSATQNERKAALDLDLRCMTQRSGCQTLCDLAPAAMGYGDSATPAMLKEACSASQEDAYWR